jgi:hypothetical protein
MIRYALTCDKGHDFEAWFGSISDYDVQVEASAVSCPSCGSADVRKAPMAPAVKRGRDKVPPAPSLRDERRKTYAVLKNLREHLKANAEHVGPGFAEEARKMHYGEAEERNIYGEATREEAVALAEEGIPALPLPPLPEDHN